MSNNGRRGIALTVNEVLESEKFWLDVQAYQKGDHSYMRAFLIDLLHHSQEVTRKRLIRAYSSHWDLPKRDMLQHLNGVDDFSDYQFLLRMTKEEQGMRLADLENNREKRKEYVEALFKKRMGG